MLSLLVVVVEEDFIEVEEGKEKPEKPEPKEEEEMELLRECERVWV